MGRLSLHKMRDVAAANKGREERDHNLKMGEARFLTCFVLLYLYISVTEEERRRIQDGEVRFYSLATS